MSNSERFLKAYNAIDKALRKQIDERPGSRTLSSPGFSTRIRAAEQKGIISRHTATDLHELTELRNAIVHDTTDLAIAEPHLETVVLIERILSMLEKPVTVSQIGSPVSTFDQSDSVANVLRHMGENHFSQVVVMKDYHIQVVTTESIALWLAKQVTEDLVDLRDPLTCVLKYEMKGSFQCVSRNLPVEAARRRFENGAVGEGAQLYCLVVTMNGKDTDRAERIVTPWDFM